jgi:ribosome-associated heat shock protein Hsp15
VSEKTDTIRLDLWLFRTRFFKTRTLSIAFAGKGKVRIQRHGVSRRAKSGAAAVHVDDVLTFAQKQNITTIKVLAMPVRRGPAPEATACYEAVLPD